MNTEADIGYNSDQQVVATDVDSTDMSLVVRCWLGSPSASLRTFSFKLPAIASLDVDGGQVSFEIADVTTCEVKDGSFDVIYSRDTILHIHDKPALFRRCVVHNVFMLADSATAYA